MQRYTVYFIWKLLHMFRVVPSPIIRSANNCIYSIWYLSHRYCYLPLSWKRWNRFECAVGGDQIPVGARFSAHPDRPWGPPSILYNGYRVFPGVKSGRGVLLTTHPLLASRSWKSKAVPLLLSGPQPGL